MTLPIPTLRFPLASIVINNYNYGRYLRQAVESAISQTYPNIEVIVVDDGSTDGSRAILAEYKTRITVIEKQNGGQASAINVGIHHAKGAFILLLDSDDYLFPEAVKTAIEAFPDGYSRVFYRLQLVDENALPIHPKSGDAFFQRFDGDVLPAVSNGQTFPSTPTSGNLFDGQKLKAVLPIPESEYRVCADSFIFIRTALQGPVRSVDRELAAYRVHGSNNFNPQFGILCDRKRLGTQIDNFYRSTALIENACQEAGFKYGKRPFEETFFGLTTLCAAHVLVIDSPYVTVLTKLKLLRLVTRYLLWGKPRVVRRLLQSIYLYFVIVFPRFAAKPLLHWLDIWMHRANVVEERQSNALGRTGARLYQTSRVIFLGNRSSRPSSNA